MTEFIDTRRRSILGLAKNIMLFSLPLMLSNLLQVLFHMADVAVVGQFSGTLALGAVGSTAVAITIFTGFLIGMGGGINAIIARNIGEQNTPEIRKTIHTGATVSLIIGVIIMIFGLTLSRPLLMLLGTKDELVDLATEYMTVYFIGMPALALFNLGNAVYSAEGDTKKPLLFLSLAGGLNVVLNLFFVIVCNLSAVGVAIASVISQYLSAILVIRSAEHEKLCGRIIFHETHHRIGRNGQYRFFHAFIPFSIFRQAVAVTKLHDRKSAEVVIAMHVEKFRMGILVLAVRHVAIGVVRGRNFVIPPIFEPKVAIIGDKVRRELVAKTRQPIFATRNGKVHSLRRNGHPLNHLFGDF